VSFINRRHRREDYWGAKRKREENYGENPQTLMRDGSID
jgi:hypothetical protein